MRQRDAGRGAGEREHERLGERAAHELPARRPERGADRQVAAARRRPHEHEAGQVDARDEQHQADRGQQQEHPRAHAAHEPLLQRHDAARCGRATSRDAAGPGSVASRAISRSACATRDARLQPADGAVEVGVTAVARSLGVTEGQRDVEVGGPGRADRIGESGRRNADDLPRLLVQVERPADDVGRAAELLLPVRVAEDDDAVPSAGLRRPARTPGRGRARYAGPGRTPT